MTHLNSADYQTQYRRYLTSIVALQVIVALFIFAVALLAVFAVYEGYKAQQHLLKNQRYSLENQELLLDCTDRRRVNSECQKYAAERTGNAVATLEQVIAAYVICADRLDSSSEIEKCAAERLKNETQ